MPLGKLQRINRTQNLLLVDSSFRGEFLIKCLQVLLIFNMLTLFTLIKSGAFDNNLTNRGGVKQNNSVKVYHSEIDYILTLITDCCLNSFAFQNFLLKFFLRNNLVLLVDFVTLNIRLHSWL